MEELPTELVLPIFTFVDDPNTCMFVCKSWKQLVSYKRCQRTYCMMLIERGHNDLLMWAIGKGCKPTLEVYYYAGKFGNGHAIELLDEIPKDKFQRTSRPDDLSITRMEKTTEKIVMGAAAGGRVDMLERYYDRLGHLKNNYTTHIATAAASNGNINVLMFLCTNEREAITRNLQCIMAAAAMKGHLSIIEWIIAKNESIDIKSFYLVDTVAYSGHLSLLKWLIEHGCTMSTRALTNIATSGNFEMIKWSYQQNFSTMINTMCSASATSGCLPLVKWLVATYTTADGLSLDKIARNAIINGHIDVIEYLYNEKLVVLSGAELFSAVKTGHLSIIKFARRNGFIWDDRLCASAIHYNDLRILKWVIKNGCPWDGSTDSGSLAIKRWLEKWSRKQSARN